MVVAADAAEHFVAQVWFHFQVDGLVLSLVSHWPNVGSNEFQVTDNFICVHTACITRECGYSMRGSTAIIVPSDL